MNPVMTVAEINSKIKNVIESGGQFNFISVRGEVTNFKGVARNGHYYFSLKDSKTDSLLNIAMFASSVRRGLDFELKTGQDVIIDGSIKIYEANGVYQLQATKITLNNSLGALFEKKLQIQKKMEAAGYFDPKYKKPLPTNAMRIGIVTSKEGAVLHDMNNYIKANNPYVQVVLYPSRIQGEGAAENIVRGIKRLDKENMDVIIVGRGGGSIEDLWCFNEEILIKAMFECKTPIISAVGHAVDHPLSELVADAVADTPTAAAGKLVRNLREELTKIDNVKLGLKKHLQNQLMRLKNQVQVKEMKIVSLSPTNKTKDYRNKIQNAEKNYLVKIEKILVSYQNKLDSYRTKLPNSFKMKFEKIGREFSVKVARLHGLSPLTRLSSGYSYTETEDGKNVRTVKDLKSGDKIKVTLVDGWLGAKVEEVNDGKHE